MKRCRLVKPFFSQSTWRSPSISLQEQIFSLQTSPVTFPAAKQRDVSSNRIQSSIFKASNSSRSHHKVTATILLATDTIQVHLVLQCPNPGKEKKRVWGGGVDAFLPNPPALQQPRRQSIIIPTNYPGT